MLTLLTALQHADAAFPSGGFAFSSGVEGFAALPLPFDSDALARYVEATLRHRWAGTDRVALVHAYRSAGDLEQLAMVDEAIEATSLAEPFRTGSRRAGRALLTTHVRLATSGADSLRDAIADGRLLGHLATVQGCLWQSLGLSEGDAEAMAGYRAITGLVSAGVRLGLIGAIDAQTIISDMLPVLAELLDEKVATASRIELMSFAPLIDIAAMRGAASGVRLFSN